LTRPSPTTSRASHSGVAMSITGGTKIFAAYPSWGAGASSERGARNLCTSTTTSFTGGRLVMVQYPYSGFDANIRC